MNDISQSAAVDSERRRLAVVRRYEILDTPPDGSFDRVAALAARAFGVPMASVTIVDEDRIWFKASVGLPGVVQAPREPGLCASVIVQGEPYVLPDTLRDELAAANSMVCGELGLRFYAAAPIVTADGYRLGTVNVLHTQPREVTQQEEATLQDLAAVVADELELRLAARRLVHLEEERRQAQQADLQRALGSHAVVDQAIGSLMHSHKCTAETAWQALQQVSQHTNTKLKVVAQALLATTADANPGLPPSALAKIIRRVLAEWQDDSG